MISMCSLSTSRRSTRTAAIAFVKTLASVHRLGVPPDIPAVDPEQATHAQIEHWRNVGKSAGGARVPMLDAAEIWLHQNVPIDKRVALVHGAPRPSNMLIADGTVVAMTDWHMAHGGDPAEDWAYCLFMRDVPLGSRPLWITLFEREAGVRMAPRGGPTGRPSTCTRGRASIDRAWRCSRPARTTRRRWPSLAPSNITACFYG